MKTKEIKEMNADERFARAVMLMNSYKNLMVFDIATGNKFGEEMWKKDFVIAVKIVKNMRTMRGSFDNIAYFLR